MKFQPRFQRLPEPPLSPDAPAWLKPAEPAPRKRAKRPTEPPADAPAPALVAMALDSYDDLATT